MIENRSPPIIEGNVPPAYCEVRAHSVALPDNNQKILYVDTEQSPYHCLKVMKRILIVKTNDNI